MKPDYLIFTDASVRLSRTSNYSASAYAAVIINTHTLKYTTISGSLMSRSISYCEGWAIFQGLRYLNKQCNENNTKHKKVLIISDSKLNVDTLTKWIYDTWDTSDWYHWKRVNNEPVINQDLYRSIIKVISNSGMKIRIVHMNSHMKKGDYDTIFARMAEKHVTLHSNLVELFVEMNALADSIAHGIVDEEYDDKTPKLKLHWKEKPDEHKTKNSTRKDHGIKRSSGYA